MQLSFEEMAEVYASAFLNSRAWSAHEIKALSQSPGFTVSAKNGFAIGRAAAGEAELITIATRPEAQGQGVGRALLNEFEEQARLRECSSAFLEVAEDNFAAQRLYERAGWERIAMRKAYYRRSDGSSVSALIFQKHL